MNIIVKSRRNTTRTLEKNFPNAIILDLTSKADEPWIKFSPFYPLEEIPIPFSGDKTGASVEGIWQGLKVFETTGIDAKKFENRTLKGLKRTIRKFGQVLGHQKGLDSTELLSYIEARKQIYAPMYLWVLKNKLQKEVEQLKQLAQQHDTIVLLDYETNGDINDPNKPLSHAFLVKHYIEGNFPI
ncbi:hypothetical protein [Aureispira sp. CCB-QB1]|uniref:DUF6939 family protein n=1 Tax=Aureispira sp. CCB-QB1 TaxID=1313421 RepID=UPI000695D0F5|nr:hypothetical protein [Aureispira sp. CCB-QB1]